MSPDAQFALPFSQIIFYEAKTWLYFRLNAIKEAENKINSMVMTWTERSKSHASTLALGFHRKHRNLICIDIHPTQLVTRRTIVHQKAGFTFTSSKKSMLTLCMRRHMISFSQAQDSLVFS